MIILSIWNRSPTVVDVRIVDLKIILQKYTLRLSKTNLGSMSISTSPTELCGFLSMSCCENYIRNAQGKFIVMKSAEQKKVNVS